jgi:hypothetical protein
MIMMNDTPPPEPEPETPDVAEPAAEFMNVPVDRIETGPQIRTEIDPEGESIRGLAETIRERGMIQPLTVVRSGEGYFLITGERRLLAARFLGLATVPIRVLPAIERQEEILLLQLIENLQREDLNPIDMAEGLRAFFQARQGDISPDELKAQLEAFRKKPQGGRPKLYRPFRGIYTSLKTAGVTVGDAANPVTKADLTRLLEELKALAARVETRLQALP